MLPADTSKWTDEDWSEMRDWLKDILRQHKATVVFTKKDGTERIMVCTTNPDMVPKVEVTESKRTKKENLDTLAVYDLEKSGWRSFTIKTVKSVAFALD